MFRGSVRVLATHSIRQFPLHFPSRASLCAITFQLQSNSQGHPMTGLYKHRGETEAYLQPIRIPALEEDGWQATRFGRFNSWKEPVPVA